MTMPIFQGDICLVRLDPTEGSEIGKTRPCLIVSRTKINNILSTVTVIPFSTGLTGSQNLRIGVRADSQNGLSENSYLVIPQIRSVSKERLTTRLGYLKKEDVYRLKDAFSFYFWAQ